MQHAEGAAATPQAAKAVIRTEKLRLRDTIGEGYRVRCAFSVASRGQYMAAKVAGFYWPMRSEFDPRPLARVLAGAGTRLALPVTMPEGLVFRAWAEGDALEPAGFGTSVPPASAPTVEPDLLIMPLAAFDRRCNRIGYGRAYYDRAVAALTAAGRRPRLVGVAFDIQETEAVPAEPHDERLDMVLTESRIIARRVWE